MTATCSSSVHMVGDGCVSCETLTSLCNDLLSPGKGGGRWHPEVTATWLMYAWWALAMQGSCSHGAQGAVFLDQQAASSIVNQPGLC